MKIVDDDGNDLPRGQHGEIWVRGPDGHEGILHLPDETAAALTPDGYFRTGDLGHVDDDGYLVHHRPKEDLIIVAGEKAVPREIEEDADERTRAWPKRP